MNPKDIFYLLKGDYIITIRFCFFMDYMGDCY